MRCLQLIILQVILSVPVKLNLNNGANTLVFANGQNCESSLCRARSVADTSAHSLRR
jgi:hypothetical protein